MGNTHYSSLLCVAHGRGASLLVLCSTGRCWRRPVLRVVTCCCGSLRVVLPCGGIAIDCKLRVVAPRPLLMLSPMVSMSCRVVTASADDAKRMCVCRCVLRVVRCTLCVAGWLLWVCCPLVVCCRLSVARWRLSVARCSLPVVGCMLFKLVADGASIRSSSLEGLCLTPVIRNSTRWNSSSKVPGSQSLQDVWPKSEEIVPAAQTSQLSRAFSP